jgi:hypothetical protein
MRVPTFLARPSKLVNCEACAAAVREQLYGKEEPESPEALRERRLGECGIPDLGRWRRELAWNLGEVRDWVWHRRYRKSLWLSCRQSGIGKTLGCYDVAQELALEGEDVMWIDCVQWFRETCMMLASDPEGAEERIRRAKRCSLLILDEVGKQSATTRSLEILWDVIDARTRVLRRRTWLTTNLDGEGLARFVGVQFETVRRRLQDHFEPWTPREDV